MTEQAYSSEQLNDLITSTENTAQSVIDSHTAIKQEIEAVNKAIETWEKLAPQLYLMRKRLLVCEELLSGKRKIESIATDSEKADQKKRKQSKTPKIFVRRKSEILTDEVIEKIRQFIAADNEYHKSKEIYHYLIREEIIAPFTGPKPEHAFAIALSRVDQNAIKYNDHYNIMAWGLPDFGSHEHLRRKALTASVRNEKGTRVASFGKNEPAVA